MPAHGQTIVVIQRGNLRGRYGFIWGDFASRQARGITAAIVHGVVVNGQVQAPRFFKLTSLTEATPVEAACANVAL